MRNEAVVTGGWCLVTDDLMEVERMKEKVVLPCFRCTCICELGK